MPANAAVKVNKTEIKNITEEPTGIFQKKVPLGKIHGYIEITKISLDPKDSGFLLVEGTTKTEGKEIFGLTIEPLFRYVLPMEILGSGAGYAWYSGQKLRLRILYCLDIPENLEVGETIYLNSWAIGLKVVEL